MIVNSRFTIFPAAAAILLAAAGPAGAATQGDPAARSSGTISISASVAGQALVTGLQDISLAPAGSDGDLAGAETLCIWTNAATRLYAVTASGSGADGAFELAAASGRSLAYTARWSAGGEMTALAASSPLLAQLPAASAPLCEASGGNATLALTAPAGAADSGAYAGQLTLLIAPQ